KRNASGEAVLNYRAKRNVQISYNRLLAGDVIEFVVPTPDSVGAAYSQAKQFGGNCVGVLFFHWPESGQQVAMDPEEVLGLAGIAPHSPKEARIEAIDRDCVAVDCVDLRVSNLKSHSPVPVHYTITSTIPIDYILPETGISVRLSAPN